MGGVLNSDPEQHSYGWRVNALSLGVASFSFGMNGLLLGMAMSVTAVMEVLGTSLAETLGGTPENAVTSAWLS
ncbi:hypothetical protein [Methanomassiliicoccus luminyensis]|nr:hypothetical protein [Methanomassiliicoccus luminyensis]